MEFGVKQEHYLVSQTTAKDWHNNMKKQQYNKNLNFMKWVRIADEV